MASMDLQATFFKRPVQLLNFLGINPYKSKTNALIFLAAFNAFSIFIGGISETSYGLVQFYRKDIIRGLDAFGPSIVKAVTTFKIVYLWKRSESFKELIEECREVLFDENEITKDPRKPNLKVRMMNLAERFNNLTIVLALFTNISFCCRPWVIMLNDFLNGKEIQKLMPFDAYLPVFMEYLPLYIVYYLFIAYSGHCTAITIGSTDGTGIHFMLYIACMFRMLQFDIESAFAPYEGCDEHALLTYKENRALKMKLAEIIARQNQLIRLATNFKRFYSAVVFGHFLSSSIIIGFGIFTSLMGSIFDLAAFSVYIICCCIQLFLYCYGADQVANESEGVAKAIYFSYWYKTDIPTRKTILMMITRSQKPVLLSVPFFTPSLLCFCSICRTSASYMTLLRTFID